MSKTMKAAVVTEFGKPLEIKQVPIPKPGPQEVLVKMICTGVCHSDLHAAQGDWEYKPTIPLIPGHEGVGEVVEAGSAVTRVKVGDRVGIPWLATACLNCEQCFAGWETFCANQQQSGYSINGSFSEYAVADSRFVAQIPEGLDSYEIAPILCAGITVYKGLKQSECRPGEWVAISGIGGLGTTAVQYAKAMGLRVIAIDIADEKLEMAKKLGAEVTVNSMTEKAVEKIMKATNNNGVKGCLVVAASLKAYELVLGITGARGTVVAIGLPGGDIPINLLGLVIKGITVRGSAVGTRLDMKEALEFVRAGKVKSQIQAVEPIENVNDIFDRMKKGKIEGRIVAKFS